MTLALPTLARPTISPAAKHLRRAELGHDRPGSWGRAFRRWMTLLYLNPFWQIDEGGFLDWRVHWWNTAGQIFIAAGLLIVALALLGSLAVIVSRFAGRRSWPYVVAALIVCCALIWVSPSGFIRDLDAHFEWNAADGFTAFPFAILGRGVGSWCPSRKLGPAMDG